MEGKKSFVLYADQISLFEKLPNDKAGELIKHIFQYVNDQDPQTDDLLLQVAFEPIKIQLKRDLVHRKEIKEKRREAGKKGGAREGNANATKGFEAKQANASKNKQKQAKQAVNVNVNVNDNVKNNTLLLENNIQENISSNEETKSDDFETKKRGDIDLLIFEIKSLCNKNGIAYDKERDRQFAKHILDSKEFGEFAQNVGQSRSDFAKNILIASIKINFRKGICSGPMKIYQNYTEVFNQTKLKGKKDGEKKGGVGILSSTNQNE